MGRVFIRCLADAMKAGRISKKRGEELQAAMDAEKDPRKLKALQDQLERSIEAKRRMELQVIAMRRVTEKMEEHPSGRGEGLSAMVVRDITDRSSNIDNIDSLSKGIVAVAHSFWADAIEALRSKNLGWTRDTKTMIDMALELRGKDTGNEVAKQFGAAWSKAADYLMRRFQAAGGDIKTRHDWAFPQTHSVRKVTAVTRDAYVEKLLPLLDRSKFLTEADGELFGGVRMNDAELTQLLGEVYDHIVTGGSSSQAVGPGNIALKRRDPRILAFKNADAWLEYNDVFGQDDIFASMLKHIDSISKETAAMEIFGPNAEASFSAALEQVRTKGFEGSGAISKFVPDDARIPRLRNIFNQATGALDNPASVTIGAIGSGARHAFSSAMLGAATLSSIGDVGTLALTAAWNGLPVARVMEQGLRLMNPRNAADRIAAFRMGLPFDSAGSMTRASTEQVFGAGFWSRMSETVIRASGLNAWTDGWRRGFGMEFMAHLADNIGRDVDSLPDALGGVLGKYGITGDDWRALRSVELFDHKGAKFMSVEKVMQSSLPESQKLDLTSKLTRMVLTETDFAVIVPDSRNLATLAVGTQRGTISGEVARGVTQFRSFPLQMVYTHLARGLYADGIKTKAAYLAALATATTIGGVASYQLKRIAKGKNPMAFDDPRLWGAGALQGGGMSLIGDFAVAGLRSRDRYGHNFLISQLGPIAGFTNDVIDLSLGTIGQAGQGKDTKFLARAARFSGRYSPGNSLFYARLAIERLIIDRARLAADPAGTRRQFRAAQQRQFKDFGAGFFSKPGTLELDFPELPR